MKKVKKTLDFRKIEIIDLSQLTKIIGGNGIGDTDGDLTSYASTRDCGIDGNP